MIDSPEDDLAGVGFRVLSSFLHVQEKFLVRGIDIGQDGVPRLNLELLC